MLITATKPIADVAAVVVVVVVAAVVVVVVVVVVVGRASKASVVASSSFVNASDNCDSSTAVPNSGLWKVRAERSANSLASSIKA
ncbi:MAG: hypothetical protein EAX86_03325 [Candidatus Heimdallarchaeota archaeon]|nr:hypothetical protein [Candidatus Heimdallarchaeota archaeon]